MRAAIALVVLVAAACGGPMQQIKVEPSAPTKPAWINTPPKKSGWVYVVGTRTRAKTLEEGKQAAHQNATAQVSNVVGAQIKSEFESTSSTRDGEYAREQIEAQTAAYIKSLEPVEEYHEKTSRILGSYYEESFDVFVLERFPLAAAEEERKRQAVEAFELGRDAHERSEEARKEEKAGSLRQARILMARARQQLAKVPPATELHLGGHGTAADLARAVEEQSRRLDELAHGVRLAVAAEDAKGQRLHATVKSRLSEALGGSKLLLRDGAKARFLLELSFSTKPGDRQVMGQEVGYITYSATVRDTWSDATFPGTGGEVRGFGKSFDAALSEAAKEAAGKIAAALAKNIGTALDDEVRGAP